MLHSEKSSVNLDSEQNMDWFQNKPEQRDATFWKIKGELELKANKEFISK